MSVPGAAILVSRGHKKALLPFGKLRREETGDASQTGRPRFGNQQSNLRRLSGEQNKEKVCRENTTTMSILSKPRFRSAGSR